jgi:PIN domain nuclease of toxin-antitoxin system
VRVLLDTHILVYWVASPERLSGAQAHAVETISPDNPALVADISLWEIALLSSLGRLRLNLPVRDWLTRATAPPLVRIAAISPPVASAAGDLADWENRDPADRLITATAKVFGAAVLTNDAAIRDAGLVQVV